MVQGGYQESTGRVGREQGGYRGTRRVRGGYQEGTGRVRSVQEG